MSLEPLLIADLGPQNGTRTFGSLEEFSAFIASERNEWTWLDTSGVQSVGNTVGHMFYQIQQAVQNLQNDPSRTVDSLLPSLNQLYSRFPTSSSSRGRFLLDLKDGAPKTAAAAVAMLVGVQVNWSDLEQAKGVILLSAFDANITPKTPSAVRRSLQALNQRFISVSEAAEVDRQNRQTDFDREVSHRQKVLTRYARRVRHSAKSWQDKRNKEIASALERFSATEQLYREHMALQGPVEYWTQKATAHKTNTGRYRTVLLGFAGIGGFILLAFLVGIASIAVWSETLAKHPAGYISLATLGVVTATIVFWIARILTRLFLSEHHLAIDAEERAVMAKTYLALTAEGQASESERHIVLGSLFRPTADGIVKDDGAPDISPAFLLSKVGIKG